MSGRPTIAEEAQAAAPAPAKPYRFASIAEQEDAWGRRALRRPARQAATTWEEPEVDAGPEDFT